VHPPPPILTSLSYSLSIMMECTPESCHCHSSYSVHRTAYVHFHYLYLFDALHLTFYVFYLRYSGFPTLCVCHRVWGGEGGTGRLPIFSAPASENFWQVSLPHQQRGRAGKKTKTVPSISAMTASFVQISIHTYITIFNILVCCTLCRAHAFVGK
jgi:hypothetical protein